MKCLSLIISILLAASSASAMLPIDTVYIGDAGNPDDSRGIYSYGGVGYEYCIGTYEVTNAQYAVFLNAVAATDTHGLFSTEMSGSFGGINRSGSSGSYAYSAIKGRETNPVNFISFWDATRFANWLTNGQPTGAQGNGTTEDGMYNLNGVTNPTNASVTRQLDFSLGQNGVAVASENEWYKAAYYSGSPTGADGDGYWLYPTQSNSITTADANYIFSSIGTVTAVGTYASNPSYYGTFDQGGNVSEWTDSFVGTYGRWARGGDFTFGEWSLESWNPGVGIPDAEASSSGFRITSLQPIPEPTTYATILGCLGLLIALMRRRF
jgi:hypothetical protein